jgi:hypothetical protein
MAYTYKVRGRTVRLNPDPGFVAVRYHDSFPNSGRARAVAAVEGLHSFETRTEVPDERLTLIPLAPPASGGPGPAAAMAALDGQPEVAKALPVLRFGAARAVPTERILLSLHDPARVGEVLTRHGLRELRRSEALIVAAAPDDADVFALCRELDKDPDVVYAEPDFAIFGNRPDEQPTSGAPDPMLDRQYALTITGALDVQAIVQGDAAIRIAVLDDGVDVGHPDLSPAVVATYDALDRDSFQQPNDWDSHGTCCAGLAAAVAGNGIGIRGVAAGCSLVAVRLAHSREKARNLWITSSAVMAEALRWAWKDGKADVLSNSWVAPPSGAIMDQIEAAQTQGRNGRGCVVLAAAGNEGGPVAFPASFDGVIAVAASNQFDKVKTHDSADGETWWGSNHGPEIAVAAPGVANITTSVRRKASGPGVYVDSFNGTSAATPIVAGACALLLSLRPDMSAAQIRDLLCGTADRIGPFPYKNGRNNHAGHGRINLRRAIEAAQALPAAQ